MQRRARSCLALAEDVLERIGGWWRTTIVDVRAGGTPPVGDAQRLTAERIAAITDLAKDAIASNDLMNGVMPTTGQRYKLCIRCSLWCAPIFLLDEKLIVGTQ